MSRIKSQQITKDALAKAKSEILAAIRLETEPKLIKVMERIAGEIETLQYRIYTA